MSAASPAVLFASASRAERIMLGLRSFQMHGNVEYTLRKVVPIVKAHV